MKSVASYPAGNQPRATALADADADGDLDVLVTSEGPAQLMLLENNGGSFSTAWSWPLAGVTAVGRPAVVDLDGDGDVDIAMTDRGGALILLEQISGSFVFSASKPLGSMPDDIAAGDLDQDGDIDLVVTGEDGGELIVLWNQGSFSFSMQSYGIPPGKSSVAVGRVTGIGPLDVVVVNANTNEVLVFHLVFSGSFALKGLAPITLDNVNPLDLSVGDVDGNGFDDIVTVGTTIQGFTLGRQQVVSSHGGGVLRKGRALWVKPGPVGSCALADLDLDGRLDLAAGGIISQTVSTMVNDGTGAFLGHSGIFFTDYSGRDLDAGDLDGDGAADLVQVSPGSGAIWVLINAAAGLPGAVTSYCTAKTNSFGGKASIGFSGLPSFGAQGFALTLSGATPGSVTIGLWGRSGAAVLPFANGVICVQPPLLRLGPNQLSPQGGASVAVPVTTAMLGQSRWYQWWYRDPVHPDGTGVALSDGLAVTFGP